MLDGRVFMKDGKLTMHPGPSGEYSVLRFTAPTAGDYQLSDLFTMCDTLTSYGVDLHILIGGQERYSKDLYFQQSDGFAGTFHLAQNDFIDISLGYGPQKNYDGGSLAVSETIQAVPEPGSFAVLGLGLVGIFLRRRK